jgi:hypothetical protein
MGRVAAVAFFALVAFAWCSWNGRGIERPPGVLAPNAPQQELVKDGPHWEIAGFDVQGLARFELEARVLSAERYRFGREAELSPVDLALGWGPMSANAVIDTLDISQSGRFYHWSSSEPMIEPVEITRHSANMHMVPLDDAARATLLGARRGNLVRLSGWLIGARGRDGWKWRSSLTRSDSGAGACEVVLVESVSLE